MKGHKQGRDYMTEGASTEGGRRLLQPMYTPLLRCLLLHERLGARARRAARSGAQRAPRRDALRHRRLRARFIRHTLRRAGNNGRPAAMMILPPIFGKEGSPRGRIETEEFSRAE